MPAQLLLIISTTGEDYADDKSVRLLREYDLYHRAWSTCIMSPCGSPRYS